MPLFQPSHPEKVQKIFTQIAQKYDRMNDLASFGLHRLWKKKLIQIAKEKKFTQALDLAAGTGDLALALAKENKFVILCDPNPAMLKIAEKRLEKQKPRVKFLVCSAEKIKLADFSVDLVVTSFGFRNMQNLDQAFREIYRVLKPKGSFLALEFCSYPPRTLFQKASHILFQMYSFVFLPLLARFFKLPPSAYDYLAHSIAQFPNPQEIEKKMIQAGFSFPKKKGKKQSKSFLWGKVQLFSTEKTHSKTSDCPLMI